MDGAYVERPHRGARRASQHHEVSFMYDSDVHFAARRIASRRVRSRSTGLRNGGRPGHTNQTSQDRPSSLRHFTFHHLHVAKDQ